jgi:tetrahydromethanopterin S-methyltransferase subunit B
MNESRRSSWLLGPRRGNEDDRKKNSFDIIHGDDGPQNPRTQSHVTSSLYYTFTTHQSHQTPILFSPWVCLSALLFFFFAIDKLEARHLFLFPIPNWDPTSDSHDEGRSGGKEVWGIFSFLFFSFFQGLVFCFFAFVLTILYHHCTCTIRVCE